MMTTDIKPRYVAHVKETPNSNVVEMQLDEKSIMGCLGSILSYFKVDRENKLHSILLSSVVGDTEYLVYSNPPSGKIYPDNITVLKKEAKPREVKLKEHRVVWYKKGANRPISVEVMAEDWEHAIEKAIKIEGFTSTKDIQFAIAMLLYRNNLGFVDSTVPQGEVGTRPYKPHYSAAEVLAAKASLVTPAPPRQTTVVTPPEPVIAAYTEKRFYPFPYKLIRNFNG